MKIFLPNLNLKKLGMSEFNGKKIISNIFKVYLLIFLTFKLNNLKINVNIAPI